LFPNWPDRCEAEAADDDSQAFSLHYQSVVPTVPGKSISLEGLLRWQHPERGLLTPGAFLTEINDPGLESEIGMFVVERAFKDMARMLEDAKLVDPLVGGGSLSAKCLPI
jgi:EAL domain-containing protein (putative c-di-GMP-specific phosphodiesterase class I)